MSTDENIFLARVAEQAERFDDMVDFLRPVIKSKGATLSIEERNLLSVGFKNLVSSKRTALRTISAIEQNPKYSKYSEPMGQYKKKIEDELYNNCEDIINTVNTDIMKSATEAETKSFFMKMVGDYYRYIAEAASGDRLEKVKQDALKNYNDASELANASLNPCNAIRLGLALNFSVFHYEVMSDVKTACTLGEKALQDALEKLDDVDEETFRDAQSIIELLRENLSLWKEEEEEGKGKNVEDL